MASPVGMPHAVAPARPAAGVSQLPSTAPCPACHGKHSAHTCGTNTRGKRERIDDTVFDGLAPEQPPVPRRAAPAASRVTGASCSLAGASTSVQITPTTAVDVAGDGASEERSTLGIPRTEWSRSPALQHTHWLCTQCSRGRPRGEAVCATCYMPRPAQAGASYKDLQARRAENVAPSKRVSNLSYMTMREQDDTSLSSNVGTLA